MGTERSDDWISSYTRFAHSIVNNTSLIYLEGDQNHCFWKPCSCNNSLRDRGILGMIVHVRSSDDESRCKAALE